MVRFHAYILHVRDIGTLFSLTSYALGMRKFKNCIPQGRVPQKQEEIKETHNVRQFFNNAFMADYESTISSYNGAFMAIETTTKE